MKNLLGIGGMGPDQLGLLVESARRFAESSRIAPDLDGLTVASLFFESSTRTRLSFDLATQRLGGRVMSFDPESSSMGKGETVRDTVLTVAAIGADILVVRHGVEGTPARVHEWTGLPVVNAGDGMSEHPTQAIADCTTLLRHFGRLQGLRVGIVGDLRHSRVAGSLLHAFPALGVEVVSVGPADLLRGPGEPDLDRVLGDLDVVYLLRVQRERGAEVPPDFIERFQLTDERATRMRPSAVVMHPGPINRGVEIADGVADGPRSLILQQVSNGVPARMAVLSAIGKGLR